MSPSIRTALIAIIVTFSFTFGSAAQTVRTGRYTLANLGATVPQLYPPAEIISATFTRKTATVGDAVRAVLRDTGYRFLDRDDRYAAALLAKPLPKVHRNLGPLPVATVLQTLVGTPYEVLVNDVTREICIELSPNYSPFDMMPLAVGAALGRGKTTRPRRSNAAIRARTTDVKPVRWVLTSTETAHLIDRSGDAPAGRDHVPNATASAVERSPVATPAVKRSARRPAPDLTPYRARPGGWSQR